MNIAAILSGKAPASKTIVVEIINLFERIGQYDGAVSPVQSCVCVLGGEVQWTVDDLDGGGGLMANKNKSLASESERDGVVFVGTNLCWVTLGGVFHLVPELNYMKKVFSLEVRNLKLF